MEKEATYASEETPVILPVPTKDGGVMDCAEVLTFGVEDYPGRRYIALTPVDERIDEIYLFRFGVDAERETIELMEIENDNEYAKALVSFELEIVGN